MADSREHAFAGTRGGVTVREWPREGPRYVVLLVHGYGEHIGRYEHVADALVAHGAAVFGPDHMGHGRSAGERVLIEDFEDVVTDVHTVEGIARAGYPGVPVVLVGHSMGGLIAARYAQRYGAGLSAVVLSGPVIGVWEPLRVLLALPEVPDVPLDPKLLSRDMAVGAAYANDPLVWHGAFKRATLEAFGRGLEAISEGGAIGSLPLLWVHGDDDRIVPPAGSRTGIERLRGAEWTERVYPRARHEVFNETNKDEVLADVTGFVDGVLGR
ncbi:alpha/beta hydrolase [Streptomyces ipomoeae]|jgi:alpha-beta hydrolase superfamily lysophospholipase|uniref:Hydrolase, alpha/beta domain protein n=2 Tax=Streptomyces ipomoeae TaxID=103232 RepID=L1KUB4_9ACTN|nr:alpha/beta hydrolase [Streptomyces ipomoeae]EKX63983.1 hydrolase, alpha/beta domain protein [Streptomyces ipomoeae 91-03]MDX2699741.1 lysophospholipase [Streptomyces ipomoeae]MDX2827191.1 lysophospholipase [Streptomyces ipomoeae]MDX2845438.1 lysophospholipase [Streptomyces ipomoeae]MDX2877598.1 lysophospholipase [Streptomyces ipomoeae]